MKCVAPQPLRRGCYVDYWLICLYVLFVLLNVLLSCFLYELFSDRVSIFSSFYVHKYKYIVFLFIMCFYINISCFYFHKQSLRRGVPNMNSEYYEYYEY